MFSACLTNIASPGLMLEDVQRKECVTLADKLVGLGNTNLEELFEVQEDLEVGDPRSW